MADELIIIPNKGMYEAVKSEIEGTVCYRNDEGMFVIIDKESGKEAAIVSFEVLREIFKDSQ